jgi:hypothetical protein
MNAKTFRIFFFRILAKINKRILPRYSHKDINRLNTFDKIIIAYRYFITRNSLD